MAKKGDTWQLICGTKILGTLTYRTVDQPTFHCDFSPTPDFAAIAPLFAAELNSLNADRMDQWEKDYQKIDALGLRLVPIGAAPEIEEFLLHIEGNTAWFRW